MDKDQGAPKEHSARRKLFDDGEQSGIDEKSKFNFFLLY